MPSRSGKCTNYAGCLLAYRNETIIIPEGDFVCPECGQPLTPASVVSGGGPKLIPVIIVGGIALLVLIAGGAVYTQAKKISRNKATTAAATPTSEPTATPTAKPFAPVKTATPGAMANATPTPPRVLPLPSSSMPTPTEPAAGASTATIKASAPNLDLKNAENQHVKAEVLKRIDLIPNLSSDNKDKLYISVDRARKMGRVMVIPFGSGKTTLSSGDVEKLKTEINSPELKQLMADPTCVFVILGFADTKGDEKTNLRISQERAQSVLNALRDKCGVQNVLHAAGMGGSTFFDERGQEKNRIAEIWAVLP